MAALTATVRDTAAPGVFRRPAVRKLGVLLLLAALVVPFVAGRWGAGPGPGR